MSDVDFLADISRLLILSLRATLLLYVGATILGTVVGILGAGMRLSGLFPARVVSAIFSWCFRGIPELVILFAVFYGSPALGFSLSPMVAGILGLGLVAGAYSSEIIRSGLISVDPGQREAALALGLSRKRYWRRIVVPQAIRPMIPPYLSYNMSLIKHTSIASIITVPEVFGTGTRLVASTFRPFEVLAVVGLIYLVLVSVLRILQGDLERRFAPKA